MEYLVKVPFSVGGNEFKPGDTIHGDGIANFLLDLLKAGVLVEKPASKFSLVKEEKP